MVPGHVLVVDDNEAVATTIVAMLEALGFVGHALSQPARFPFRLAQQHYDAVIADLDLPGGPNGLQLLQQVRRVSPMTRRILISGREGLVVPAGGIAQYVLAKPLGLAMLRRVLVEDLAATAT